MRDRIRKRVGIIIVVVFIILLIPFFLILAHLQGYERIIYVEKDAYVYEHFPNNNYGDDDYLRVGNYEFGKIQTLYCFNISSLSDGWTEVEIIVNFDYGSSLIDVAVNLTYEIWDEMTITWNNKPKISVYKGHILCDGFDFRIPLRSDQVINDSVSICLYGRSGESDGYIQGYSKEGASKNNDIAWIELNYMGIDPIILTNLNIAGIITLMILQDIAVILLVIFNKTKPRKISITFKKLFKRNIFGAEWLNDNLNVNNVVNQNNEGNQNNLGKPKKLGKSNSIIQKEINQYITIKLEYGKTFIYVNGRRFIQCIRLILNIPKDDVPLYDEVESIDEAANLYKKHVYQNRIVMGPMAAPVSHQSHTITPEQEFWGHCSNIQAWVEHDYDTRILMSNISFPLLRELARAGDSKAKRVYKEEIALRLESGYPSVVQYLLTQGYIQVFSPEEFKTILETTDLIKNLSSDLKILSQFLRSCVSKFPTLVEEILLQILKLSDGKNIFLSSIQIEPRRSHFSPYLGYKDPQFFFALKTALDNLLTRFDEEISEIILDCIQAINEKFVGDALNIPNISGRSYIEVIKNLLMNNIPIEELNEEEKLLFQHKILEKIRRSQSRCSYCGKEILKGQKICEWCGHKRDDDEGGFFPYPFIFKPPGGGGSIKGTIMVPVKIKN